MAETRKIAELGDDGRLKDDQIPEGLEDFTDVDLTNWGKSWMELADAAAAKSALELGGAAYLDPAEVVTDAAAQIALSATFATPQPAVTAERPRITRMLTLMDEPGWQTAHSAGTGNVADDTTDFVLGSMSQRITTGPDTGNFARRHNALGPFDLTGESLVVWVKTEELDRFQELWVYAFSTAFTAYFLWAIDQLGTARFPIDGEWTMVTLPFSRATATGNPDRSAIIGLGVRCRGDGTAPVKMWCNGIGTTPEAPKAVVSVTFDDATTDHYTVARPIMDAYGFPGTEYLVAQHIGQSGRLTLDQLRALRDFSGWQIAGHAYSANPGHTSPGFAGMTEQQLEAEFGNLRAWLHRHGFDADHVAYPFGRFSRLVLDTARRYFATGRSTITAMETYPPADPYRLRTLSATDPAAMLDEVDKAIASGAWLVTTFHVVGAGGYATSDFETFIDGLATRGVSVRTVGDVIRSGVTA